MLLAEKLSTPKGLVRSPQAQALIDAQCQQLALYQFPTCPFCIKVRKTLAALSLPIEKRNAQHDPAHRDALLVGGGTVKVPCLRISEADGKTTWLYESTAINDYLQQRFGS